MHRHIKSLKLFISYYVSHLVNVEAQFYASIPNEPYV